MDLCCCSRIIASIFILLSIFGVNNNVAAAAKDYKNIIKPPFLTTCSMANLYAATRIDNDADYKHYAYGLTLDCTFFFFELSQYHIFDRALDFYESQIHLGHLDGKFLCPAEMFNVQYIPQNYTPYFEVLEIQTGTPHYIPVVLNQSIYFTHIFPRTSKITLKNWQFSPSGWVSQYQNFLIHSKPRLNPRTGRQEVKTYIREKHEPHPGKCIRKSFTHGVETFLPYQLFQIYLILGDEAHDLKIYFLNGTEIPQRPPPSDAPIYYFYSIIAVIVVAGITILLGFGISVWKIIRYLMVEKQRHEIEKFVVACYVEKLEKISKVANPAPEKKKSKKKKSKKRHSPSESQSSYHHRRRRHHRKRSSESKSVSKNPHGSKLIPIPKEKDLFVSDVKNKIEVKPAAVQEPRKSRTNRRDPSKGSNASVCSLKSVTQSVDDSLDWTGKGVRVSQRKTALQQLKDDQQKDEDEAYKLGMNLSTYKRKKKRQQHGIQHDDEESKKDNKTPLSVASGMTSNIKPVIPTKTTATPAPPSATNSKLLASDTPAATNSKPLPGDTPAPAAAAQDEARFQRAQKELQERYEAEQRKREQEAAAAAAKNNAGAIGGGAAKPLPNNNPYGSLSVPLDGLTPQKNKK